MAHCTTPAQWAKPGTIRRLRRELGQARTAYHQARHAYASAPPERNRYHEPVGDFGKLLDDAMDARDAWTTARQRLAFAEQVRDEMAAGARDALGRPKS